MLRGVRVRDNGCDDASARRCAHHDCDSRAGVAGDGCAEADARRCAYYYDWAARLPLPRDLRAGLRARLPDLLQRLLRRLLRGRARAQPGGYGWAVGGVLRGVRVCHRAALQDRRRARRGRCCCRPRGRRRGRGVGLPGRRGPLAARGGPRGAAGRGGRARGRGAAGPGGAGGAAGGGRHRLAIASPYEEELERLVRRAVQELSAGAAAHEERLGWHAAGLSEHASVGSFARLALELMVAGAPPRLARLAARAQDEEVLHAHVSLALGGAGGGGERLEFPEHDLQLRRDLAALGDAAVSEGLQGEGRAALKLFGQASAALAGGRPALGRLCWAMGRDEAGHAELAAETLEWLRRAAGATPPAVEVAGGGVRVVELRQVEAVM
ncbi:unnamed protein product [Prorocentrum cordatum]|uniref:Ferritin-like domain-containing protein n=1 Tax=Prorocentrum cordatum TaxID=2364126 RepID=A0ABN9SDL9_9DINO|nr:unnamed protein product [Polarella glacialis]